MLYLQISHYLEIRSFKNHENSQFSILNSQFSILVFLVFINNNSVYANDASVLGVINNGSALAVRASNSPIIDYIYVINQWRFGFSDPIIFRNYAPTISATAIDNASTSITNDLGYGFTPENLPWNQGPYQNRLYISQNNFGIAQFDAVSFPYVVDDLGNVTECIDHSVLYTASNFSVIVDTTTGLPTGHCNNLQVNAGILLFNTNSAINISTLAINTQTHLLLHEFSHLFGLGHIFIDDIDPLISNAEECESVMLSSIKVCNKRAPSNFAHADIEALEFLD